MAASIAAELVAQGFVQLDEAGFWKRRDECAKEYEQEGIVLEEPVIQDPLCKHLKKAGSVKFLPALEFAVWNEARYMKEAYVDLAASTVSNSVQYLMQINGSPLRRRFMYETFEPCISSRRTLHVVRFSFTK